MSDPDVGMYYYFVHRSWTIRDCAEIARACIGRFTTDEWEQALRNSTKIHPQELGRAGGIIFIYSDGPTLTRA